MVGQGSLAASRSRLPHRIADVRGELLEVRAEHVGQLLRLRVVVGRVVPRLARPEHVVRMTWYVTDKRAYNAAARDIGRAYRAVFGAHYPAMTLVEVADLLEDGARVEIEATAVVP